jgi:hypothetical protein
MGTDARDEDAPMRVPEALAPLVRRLVHELVAGKYEDLIRSGVADGWTSERLASYVGEMKGIDGAPLTDPPETFFQKEDTTLALGDDRYSVWVDLWTTRGPSAYSLIIDFDPTPGGYEAHFKNLEVM